MFSDPHKTLQLFKKECDRPVQEGGGSFVFAMVDMKTDLQSVSQLSQFAHSRLFPFDFEPAEMVAKNLMAESPVVLFSVQAIDSYLISSSIYLLTFLCVQLQWYHSLHY